LPDRLGNTLTVFLASVAFLFVLNDALPKVSYLTTLDLIILANFGLLFMVQDASIALSLTLSLFFLCGCVALDHNKRRAPRASQRVSCLSVSLNPPSLPQVVVESALVYAMQDQGYGEPHTIDLYMRILYPIFLLLSSVCLLAQGLLWRRTKLGTKVLRH
jgi:hypothetical protein